MNSDINVGNSERLDVKVSICCIAYNQKEFIRECLDGFLRQKTNFKFEVLIYDDASTDGTKEIIEEYRANHPKIIFPHYQKDNQFSKGVRGLMAIYNYTRSNGKYIALCEGDDYWTDNYKLQKQADFLDANPEFSGSYHDTMVKYVNENKPNHLFREKIPNSISAEDTIALFAPFHTSSFIFRKDSFSFEPFLKKVKSADMASFSIVASKGLLGKVDGVMSVYRKHLDGITNSAIHNSKFNQDRIKLIKHLNRLHNYMYNEKAKQIVSIYKKNIWEDKKRNNYVFAAVSKCRRACKKIIKFFSKNQTATV